MRISIILISIFICSSFSPGDSLKSYAKKKLKEATKIEQIKKLYRALNKRNISFPDLNVYIPSIEPINPYKKKKITLKLFGLKPNTRILYSPMDSLKI